MATKKVKDDKEYEQVASPDPAARVGVEITNVTSTSDADALHGHFCRVVSGEHEGRYGVLEQTAEADAKGRPKTVVVRTRDEHDERIVVNYSDLRPAQPGGRVA